MNKNVLKLMFAAALAMVAVYNVYSSLQEKAMTELANVEALANGENASPCGGPKVEGECQSRNTINCKDLYGCQ